MSNFHSIQSIKKRKKAFHLNSSKSINLESIDKWPIAPDVFRSVDKSNGAQTRHYLYLAMPLACKSDSMQYTQRHQEKSNSVFDISTP